jgi:hypothetical protein
VVSERSNKRLVREERWFRVYAVGPYPEVYESKFGTGELSLAFDEFAHEWEKWNHSERVAFARAYNSKTQISSEDENILEFVAKEGDEQIWGNLALCFARHPNKEWALRFLLDRLTSATEVRANFFQALGELGHSGAIPQLKSLHDQLMAAVVGGASGSVIREFLWCCSALVKLAGPEPYTSEIRRFASHSEAGIRKLASLLS